ncbi:hypothetical protein LCGC14_0418220 [marine sediment metagenome]|uniref:Glycosyl transferase family 1 domain-containing protein n=1 Tax=marine sediment metagenome TaxID=412755 RepID=A0A0F9VDV2_9ZZZZ
MRVGFITFESWHEREQIGSSRIRARWVANAWPEAEIYQPGQKYDVEIYQKVYWQRHMNHNNPAIKILDICDPDWAERPDNAYFREIVENFDAVTAPTEQFRKFFNKLLPKMPFKVIPDRLDLSQYKQKKIHKGDAKSVVWFGYAQNVNVIRQAVPTLRQLKLKCMIISNDMRLMVAKRDAEMFNFVKYDENTINQNLIKHGDIALLPSHKTNDGDTPYNAMFKSDNKVGNAQALGLPVAVNAESLEFYMKEENRKKTAEEGWEWVKAHRDVNQSVVEYKELIETL